MPQALQSDQSFNPYIEQLATEVLQAQGAGKVSKDTLAKWAGFLRESFSLGIDNVVHNQAKLLALAKILNDAAIRLPMQPKDLPKAISTPVLEGIAQQSAQAAALVINIRFAVCVMTQGVQAALAQYAADFLSPRVMGADFKVNTPVLRQLPWMEYLSEDTADLIARNTPFDAYGSRENTEIILMRAIRAMNFEHPQGFEAQRILATRIIVPWLQHLLDEGDYSTALYLEGLLFENFVRRREMEQHYQEAYRLWAPMTEKAGRTLQARMGAPAPVTKPGEKPRIGFFVHRASMLAHIQLLHTTLQGMGDVAALPYRMTVYVWSDYDPAMDTAFTKLGLDLVWLSRLYPVQMPYLDRMLGLRKKMEQDGVQLLVWMCVMHMKGFALGLGLAPRQIYWNAKYQVGCFETPDDRITWHDNGDVAVTVDGKPWRSVPMTFSSMQGTLDTQKLATLRQDFSKWKTILGTMAREDILNSPPFLNTVARILKNNPDAVYFYTGRQNLPSIQQIFKDHGVEKQTVFVGWVDTVAYANLVDVYLDSWPARSGMTAFNVFEAAKPFVSIILKDGGAIHTQFSSVLMARDEQDRLHFSLKDLDHAFDDIDNGQRFFPVVDNKDDYMRAAQRLIDDKNLRQKTGAVFEKLGKHMADSSRAGRRLDIILRDNLKAAGAL